MSATTMVMTMAMAVSMYGVLRFHFGMILDLRCGGAGDCAQFNCLTTSRQLLQ